MFLIYLGGNRCWVPLYELSLKKEKNPDGKTITTTTERRRLRKFELFQTLSCLFHLLRFVLASFFLDFNFKRLYRSSGRGKENRFRLFTSSTKREIRHFHEVWCSCSNGKLNVRKKRKEKKACCIGKDAVAYI